MAETGRARRLVFCSVLGEKRRAWVSRAEELGGKQSMGRGDGMRFTMYGTARW